MPKARAKPSRSNKRTKPTTIHSCAQFGDVLSLQKLLQDNPALLNEKDPFVGNTPLHVSAEFNHVEIVKYLLAWQGPEMVELEAKNMFGETPLHIAAKNGCNDVARMLLTHGAFVEAKENNTMTPLHFSVRYSLQFEDCTTIETLLEYNADCSVTDDEGMTPLDRLSQGSCTKKLRELLNYHLGEQRKRKVNEVCNESKIRMKEIENELSKIVGLEELKIQLQAWAKGMLLDENRRALGIEPGTRRFPHMAFLGNPGTGKTMIARTLGKLLHMVGILPTDKVTEVQRTDLVDEHIGRTGPKTRRKIKEAEGGILFVDNAHQLISMDKSDDIDFGLEALEEIMSVMDKGKVVVIFAGYCKPMEHLISSKDGFYRRITEILYFNDFNPEELAKILHIKMVKQTKDSRLYGFKLHRACTTKAISDMIERETQEKQRKEMNGRLIDKMLVNARGNLDRRLSFDCNDVEELCTITMDDLALGVSDFVPFFNVEM